MVQYTDTRCHAEPGHHRAAQLALLQTVCGEEAPSSSPPNIGTLDLACAKPSLVTDGWFG